MQNISKRLIVAIIVLIIAIVAGGWFWYASVQKERAQVEQQTNTITGVENKDIEKTYRNQQYGFEMKIPTDWEVTSEDLSEEIPDGSHDQTALCIAPNGKGDAGTLFGAGDTSCSVSIFIVHKAIRGYVNDTPKTASIKISSSIDATMFDENSVEFEQAGFFWTMSINADTSSENKKVFLEMVHSLKFGDK